MRKFFMWAVMVVLVLTGIILLIMYNMGDRLLEEVIKSDLLSESAIPSQGENATNEEGTQQKTGNNGIGNEKEENSVDVTPEPSSGMDSGNEQPVKETEKPSDELKTKDLVKPAKEPEIVTMDEINEIKDEVSASDKITAAAMVMKRLKAKDIDELKALLSSGLSTEEKKKAKEIAYKRFSEKEIEQIKAMYEKYMGQEK